MTLARWLALPLLAVGLQGLSTQSWGQMPGAEDVHPVEGNCSPKSHTAEGQIGTDLTKQSMRYACNLALIAFFPNRQGHVMVNFIDKRSHRQTPLGFAGLLSPDGNSVQVSNVYMVAGQATPVSAGECKFYMDGRRMKQIFCFAVVDDRERRTTAMVAFDAAPNQVGNSLAQ